MKTPLRLSSLFCLFALAFLLISCATDRPTNTGNPATDSANAKSNARSAATNQALIEAGKILGQISAQSLYSVAQQEMSSNGNVDFGSAVSQGLFASAPTIASSDAIGHIIDAYSAASLPNTSAAATSAFAQAVTRPISTTQATNAIATVISAAAGAPPGNPAASIASK